MAEPRPNRPTEGQLFINVELSPMASPAFEVGRLVKIISGPLINVCTIKFDFQPGVSLFIAAH